MINRTATMRRQQVFVAMEAKRGQLMPPWAKSTTGTYGGVSITATGATFIVPAGSVSLKQQPSFTDSSNIRDTRDKIERFQDKMPAAEWSFSVYLTPSGTAGTPPMEGKLLTSLLGKEVVSANRVEYLPDQVKPSFSLWTKADHTVFFAAGCTVGQASFALATTDGSKLELSGKGMRMGWAGTGTLAAAASSGATTVKVDDSRKYTVGALIEFVPATGAVINNASKGFEVTAINATSNTLTIAPALSADIATGTVVRGFLPAETATELPLENRQGFAEIDGNDLRIQTMSVTVNDEPKYLDDEITRSGFIEDYAESGRSVEGSLAIYFRENDLSYFQDGLGTVYRQVALKVGTEAGRSVEIIMPKCQLSVPEVTDNDPSRALNMPFMALGTSGEDSISITYK